MVILMEVHRLIYQGNMRRLNGLMQSDYQAVEGDYQKGFFVFLYFKIAE
jgi:hypothetical protein